MPEKVEQKKNLTPPDGGWGWMVVLGACLINLVNQSIFASYGLIFGERLKSMANGRATALTLIMSLNMVVTNLTGLFVGPILKKISIRTITCMGILCAGSGMIICSFSSAVWHICIGYSLVSGIGLGLLVSSTFLAINDYFTTKKSTAVGLSMAGTSLGQMLMPTWIGILLKNYGFNYTAMVLGFMSFSGMMGVMLFKPVFCCKQWANTKTEKDQSTDNIHEEKDDNFEKRNEQHKLLDRQQSKDHVCQNIEEEVKEKDEEDYDEFGKQYEEKILIDRQLSREDENIHLEQRNERKISFRGQYSEDENAKPEKRGERKISFSRQDPKDEGRTFKKSRDALNRRISREERGPTFKKSRELLNSSRSLDDVRSIFEESREKAYRASIVEIASSQIFELNEQNQRWHTKLSHALGLPLLKDLIFVNILMGLGFGSLCSVTFSTFFPLFLQEEAGLSLMQTTTCMSVLAFADVIGRITGPQIDRRLKLTNRDAFIVGCLMMSTSRTIMVRLSNFQFILVAFFFIGFFRSMTVINQNLTISEHIPKEKLPSAVGLNMVNKAIVTLTFGQSLGYLKDIFSYGNCIQILNLGLYLIVIGYLLERLTLRLLNKNKKPADIYQEDTKV